MRTTPRRRIRSAPAAATVAIAVLLGSCTGQESARSYSNDVEKEFLFGCTTGGTARVDGRYVRSDTTDPDEREQIEEAQARMEADVANIDQICQCTYDALEEDVEFDRLKDITNDLERQPDALPENIRKIGETCADREGEPS